MAGATNAGFLEGFVDSVTSGLEKRHAQEEGKKKELREFYFKALSDPNTSQQGREEAQNQLNKLLNPESKKALGKFGQVFQKLKQGQGQASPKGQLQGPQGATYNQALGETGLTPQQAGIPQQQPSQGGGTQLTGPPPTPTQAAQSQRGPLTGPPASIYSNYGQDQAKQAQASKLAFEKAQAEQSLPIEKAQMEQKQAIGLEGKQKEFEQNLKQINDSKDMGDEEKREARLALFGVKPTTPPSLQRVHVQTDDGKWEPAEYNPKTGAYEKPDHTPIAPSKIKDVTTGEPATAEKSDPAEVKGYAALNETKGMKPDQARTAALEQWGREQKEKETRAKLAEDRSTLELKLKSMEVASNLETAALERANKGKTYSPGGPSLANPTGDSAIDTGAWDYLTTGHIPFTGFSGGGKGKTNPREKMVARAGELLADLGLSASDLPAIRGKIKSDTGALSKITSLGASVQQFEGTLQRNMATAQKLSEAFKRGDMPFVNRIIGAFKTGTGDSEALNLAAQLHGVAREWGKIMAGSTSAAGVPVSEGNAADVLFSKGITNGQLLSMMQNVIVPDVNNRSAAIQEEKDRLITGLRTDTKLNPGPPTSPNGKLDGPSSGPKKGDKQKYNGADYEFDGTQWVKSIKK